MASTSAIPSTSMLVDDSENVEGLADIPTPRNQPLSGKYMRSFAYTSIKDRLPVILTKVIDHFSRNRETIMVSYGEEAIEEIRYLIGFISQLKNELVTNKTLKPLRFHEYMLNEEATEWNDYLLHRTETEGEIPTWFNTIWLYCECYMYRVLAQEISLMLNLPRYDPFEDDKQASFMKSIESVNAVASYVKTLIPKENGNLLRQSKSIFQKLLYMCLWSNRYDLSLSAGSDSNQSSNLLDVLKSLKDNIISNDWECAWDILTRMDKTGENIIDIVLDNSGYELFTDFCLAAFLCFHTATTKIRFYVKKYPWFVSDATLHDFYWALEYMNALNPYPDLIFLSKMFFDFLDNETWSLEEEPYWTSPYNYLEMKVKDRDLYDKLSEAKLIIFKGDLNYRKLLGDINLDHTTHFLNALTGFDPTNILSLRTVKSDICVGLAPCKVEELYKKDVNWMLTGEYGLIQMNIDFNSSSDTCISSDTFLSVESKCSETSTSATSTASESLQFL